MKKDSKMEVKSTTIEEEKQISKLPQELKNLVAGGFAGMLAKSVVAPIDRIKILYQITNAPFYLVDVPNVITRIIKEEGVTALWKGNTATMIRVFPYAGIQFMVFNKLKSYIVSCHNNEHDGGGGKFMTVTETNNERKIINQKGNLTPIESLVAGSTAGAMSVLFTYPLDLTRAQLAVLKRQKGKKNDGFVQIFRNNYSQWVSLGYLSQMVVIVLGKVRINYTHNHNEQTHCFSKLGNGRTF